MWSVGDVPKKGAPWRIGDDGVYWSGLEQGMVGERCAGAADAPGGLAGGAAMQTFHK